MKYFAQFLRVHAILRLRVGSPLIIIAVLLYVYSFVCCLWSFVVNVVDWGTGSSGGGGGVWW